MRTRRFLLTVSAGLAVILLQTGHYAFGAEVPVALTGQVTSKEEGAMEGVLVNAKKAGSTITITVVSDEQGHYHFPAAKLEPGKYSLTIRAVGYELAGRAAAKITPQKTATANLKLRQTKIGRASCRERV